MEANDKIVPSHVDREIPTGPGTSKDGDEAKEELTSSKEAIWKGNGSEIVIEAATQGAQKRSTNVLW